MKRIRSIIMLSFAVMCLIPLAVGSLYAQEASGHKAISHKEIQINISDIKGRHGTFYKECVSTGRAYLLLRRDHQEHILQAAHECGFKYLRFHGLLQDDLGVYRENGEGNPIYSWQYVDEVYDFIVDNGLRPFVVFDFMPESLASNKSTIYWEKSNISPPKDYKKWGNLIHEVVKHFTERYGKEEVGKWFFEVWNEPDQHFFTGNMDDYLKMYDYAARAVKAVSPDYRVGGPAIAGNMTWITGLTWDYWDPLRDSYQAASFILSRLKDIGGGKVKALSYCVISDVFEEDGPPTYNFHGGFGLINLQGIRKPAYFAYKFLNQLGDTELACNDSDAIACRNKEGVQVLFWNDAVRQDIENRAYYNQDRPSLPAGKTKLSITGLKEGKYDLEVYRVGYRHNDAYTLYKDMKYTGSLSRQQIKYLETQSLGLPERTEKITLKKSSA